MWNGRDSNESSGAFESGAVFLGTEYRNAIRWSAVGFDAFERLETVVEAGAQAMDTEVRVGDDSGGAPVAAFNRVGGFNVAENC